ncbi:hypothetical protein [Halomicrobium katesii]|uniref:hypothetical protein n=1 Tax=Halomicrobium katesii TaxID=437163 RepID=UPI0005D26BFB|nr:hypothetical protein [Halomicrobium katesii]
MSNTATEQTRPGFPGVSVVEALGVLAVLLALQFLYAASGFADGVLTIAHRIVYIMTTALACTWTLRLHDGFSLKFMGVTVGLVAGGIVSIVAFATAPPLAVTAAAIAVPVGFGIVVRLTDALPNWTGTHTTLLLVVLGTTAMFVAAAPRDVGSLASVGFGIEIVPVTDGLSSRLEIVRDGVTSVVHAPLAAVGAGLYVLGRVFE